MKRTQRKLTYELCKKVALRYKHRNDLQKGDSAVYKKIRTNGWVELQSHMVQLLNPKGYWTYERCKDRTSAMKSLNDLKGSGGLISALKRNGWYWELTKHFKGKQIRWTEESVRELFLKCNNATEVNEKYPGAYSWAQKHGLIDNFSSHFVRKIRTKKT